MKKNQLTEVLILTVLAVVFIFYCSNLYLIKPLKTETASLEQQIQQKELSLRSLNAATSSYDANLEKLNAYAKGLENHKDDSYSNEFQETYFDYLKVNIYNHNYHFDSISSSDSNFSAGSVYPSANAANRMLAVLSADEILAGESVITADNYNSYVNALKSSGGRLDKELAMTTLSFSVQGNYNDVLAFVNDLLDNDKNVIINNIALELGDNALLNAPDDPIVFARMVVMFPRVPSLNSICTVDIPDPLPPYAFPADINDGSYKRSAGFLTSILDLFS